MFGAIMSAWQKPRYKEAPEQDFFVPRLVLQNYVLPPKDLTGTGRVPRNAILVGGGAFQSFDAVATGLAGNPTNGAITQPLVGNITTG